MKKSLLESLSPDRPLSGENLARSLGVTRQALHKQVQVLRRKGYAIQGKPRSGYVLKTFPDVLDAEAVRSGLKTRVLGKKIQCFPKLDSTQDKAREWASGGHPDGSVVVALEQTRGRGRLGRKWESAAGGLWFSVLLRPGLSPQNVPFLAIVAGLAVAEALEKTLNVSCGLKWPNDVVTAPSIKKLCGILIEMAAESDRVQWVVLGLGLNANNRIPASLRRTAVSLKELTGADVDRSLLLRAVLESLESVYRSFLRGEQEEIVRRYLKKSVLKGRTVRVRESGRRWEGKFAGIGEDGCLILSLASGEKKKFYSGETTLKNS